MATQINEEISHEINGNIEKIPEVIGVPQIDPEAGASVNVTVRSDELILLSQKLDKLVESIEKKDSTTCSNEMKLLREKTQKYQEQVQKLYSNNRYLVLALRTLQHIIIKLAANEDAVTIANLSEYEMKWVSRILERYNLQMDDEEPNESGAGDAGIRDGVDANDSDGTLTEKSDDESDKEIELLEPPIPVMIPTPMPTVEDEAAPSTSNLVDAMPSLDVN